MANVVIVIVIVIPKHQNGEATPDGGTPQWENLCAHTAQTLYARENTLSETYKQAGVRLGGRKHGFVYGACGTAHGGGCEVADVVAGSGLRESM